MTEWLGLPALAATHGGQIDNLLGWIHVFMLILFVGWGSFIVYTLVRFRQSRQSGGELHGDASRTTRPMSRSASPWSKRFS